MSLCTGLSNRPHKQVQITTSESENIIKDHASRTPNTDGGSGSPPKDAIMHDLARRYTAQSENFGFNPFLDTRGDSPLNPNSPNFRAREWAKAVVALDSVSYRTAGVCFKNLNVHGDGVATDYQKDVASIWLGVEGIVRSLFRLQIRRKIDILQGVDGLLRKGEMLAVLGPPGSGCSTLLKTIAGETHGIHVNTLSLFNYQGMNLLNLRMYTHCERAKLIGCRSFGGRDAHSSQRRRHLYS